MSLNGAIAAAVTPLRGGGQHLDDQSFAPLVRFLADGGVDGLLACGTTGEGVLLSVEERERASELFVAARPPGFQIAVHAGAQTTRDTVQLAAHAMEIGADAVAVIAPPYYPLDEDELVGHLRSAANACEPLPFYLYEFAARSGYAVSPSVIERLRDAASNLKGLKVSDVPFEAVEPYLDLGLDVFIGQEPLFAPAAGRGAIGTVSGLATAWPSDIAELVRDRSERAIERVRSLRASLASIPFQAAMKAVLVAKGVLRHDDVRPPLRTLTDAERATVAAL